MSRRIDMWLPYVDDVLALWTELGDGFIVGKLTQQNVTELRVRLATALDHVNALEAQLGLAADERDAVIGEIEELAAKFRGAVVATYGARSSEAKRVPKVTPARTKGATKPKQQ